MNGLGPQSRWGHQTQETNTLLVWVFSQDLITVKYIYIYKTNIATLILLTNVGCLFLLLIFFFFFFF